MHNGSESTMTVLGAVVFGGLFAVGVLWLLVTAPTSDSDEVWDHAQNSIDVPETLVLAHSSPN